MKNKNSTKKEINRAYNEQLLPDGIGMCKLKKYWDLASTAYQPIYSKMRILDACDRGKFWEVLGKDIPPYQLLPDTNYINRIKNALVATIYATGEEASVTPRSEDDLELAMNINLALHALWEQSDVGMLEMQAGAHAALFNVGITQVGWDKDIICGTANKRSKGNVTLKDVHPMNFMRDPAADSLDTAAYCIYHNSYHSIWFEANDMYKKEFKKYKELVAAESILSRVLPEVISAKDEAARQTDSEYHKLVVFYIKTADKLWEIHTIDTNFILAVKEIKPAIYPFAELYCTPTDKDPIGVSPCAIAFPNYVIYNTMNSMIATQAYKAMRPPRFINGQSGLNVYSFAKHGNDPDKTFVVNGDASRAVHYQEFPALPIQAEAMLTTLPADIDKITGIDGQYTGRDTGSVITTGGMEELMARVTMLDTTRIKLYDHYAKKLTQLVLENLIEYGDNRTYITKDPMSGQLVKVEVDFDKITKDVVFDYDINISEILPRNKARLAQTANMLMEKQMQYNMDPAIITPEEWLSMQDLPNMEYIARRMKWARAETDASKFLGQLNTFNDAMNAGVDPGNALDMAINTSLDQSNPMSGRVPNQENVGNINPIQTKEEFVDGLLQEQTPPSGLPL